MLALPFSVVIISKNEEASIARAIASVKSICDDIVVIDSGSADATKEVSQNLGARVFEQEWLGYSKTKNKGNELAKHKYIFSLDADEAFSAELIEGLKQVFANDPKFAVYKVNRLNHFAGQPITHGAWHPDWQYRLFDKTKHQWQETDEVHENLNWNQSNAIGTIEGNLLHYTTQTEAYYVKKMQTYAQLFAAKRKASGKGSNPVKAYSSAYFRFFKEYILQAGFLDGMAGYKIAKAHFVYTKEKYL